MFLYFQTPNFSHLDILSINIIELSLESNNEYPTGELCILDNISVLTTPLLCVDL